MFRITRKEARFFDMFVETCDLISLSAGMLNDLIMDFNDVEVRIKKIEEVEHQCDLKVHDIFEELNKSFITPIDREDIYLIAKELDVITDRIESTAHLFKMYNISQIREEARELVRLVVQCTNELRNLMKELHKIHKTTLLMKYVVEINRIENEGDRVHRAGITKLFLQEKDPIEIIRWRDIIGYLEGTIDACEDVANVVLGVVMKHA
jgi:uncharacterized protein